MSNSMIFSKSTTRCDHHHNPVLEHHPSKVSWVHLQGTPTPSPVLGDHSSPFCVYRFASSEHFIWISYKTGASGCGGCTPRPASCVPSRRSAGRQSAPAVECSPVVEVQHLLLIPPPPIHAGVVSTFWLFWKMLLWTCVYKWHKSVYMYVRAHARAYFLNHVNISPTQENLLLQKIS